MNDNIEVKEQVREFWNEAAFGETLFMNDDIEKTAFINHALQRYSLEPYIIDFADFANSKGKKVLEIGVGLGADHQRFAEAGAILYGIDLTERAVESTQKRLILFGLQSQLTIGDAEALVFADSTFDKVYSWGVIHHSPNTIKAVKEMYRVLKPNGEARVMIYHKKSMVGYMLWLRYALLKGKPFMSLKQVYDKHLESPGTKAYTVAEAKEMFAGFTTVRIQTKLTHADLLSSSAGQRHRGLLLAVGRKLLPRSIIRKLLPGHGLFMLIHAIK